jgi:hypothetical protein
MRTDVLSTGTDGYTFGTDTDIIELLRFMEDNPLFKHQLLTYFYRFKQGKPGNQEPQESPFE